MEEMGKAIKLWSESEGTGRDVVTGVQAVGRGFLNLGLAVRDCDKRLEGRERKLFYDISKWFATCSVGGTCKAIGLNVMVNGVDIYKELDAAYTAYLAREFEDFGRDIGSAFAHTFIGNSGITSSDASRLRDMQQAYLYP